MKKRTGIFAGAILFVLTMVLGVHLGISYTVDYAVGSDATRKALNWSSYLITRMPDLPSLIETGRPNKQQIQKIKTTSEVGDIFRFKLFDASGNLVLISDELAKNLEAGARGDHSGKAAKVLSTGENQVSLNDGTKKQNRPDLYVEAYVPVMGKAGKILGVVEVYLDQTAASVLFHRLFNFLAIAITAVLALTFGLPYLAFLKKNQQEQQSRNKANYLAKFDQVAKVLNRSGLMEQLRTRRLASNFDLSKASVIFFDADNFKTINDTFGHKAGDAFLTHIGQSITESLEADDLVGRLGGDEFLVIASRETPEDIHALVEKIQSRVSSPLRFEGSTIIGHLSIGIHMGEGEETSIEDRMQKADVALYQAKFEGRNTYRTFTHEMQVNALRRRTVEAAILSGLDEERFEVYYQPLLHQKTKQCAGFEALLRLKDKDGNSITPTEFIPVAESMGKICTIGSWVLKTAINSVASWPSEYFISVNLSARQFDDNSLVSLVTRLLKEANVDPSRLELEVTESLLMDNTDSISSQLSTLRKLGVKLSLDDFGTGYSSLGYLWQFGFDKLKIDRSFIVGLDHNTEKASEILDTIILLGHRLDMTVTAEGIETVHQEKILSDLECDHFQGFLFGRPMPAADLAPYFLNSIDKVKQEKSVTPIVRQA